MAVTIPASETTKKKRKSRQTFDLLSPSYMTETNGGGRIEHVPGFNALKAMTAGFKGGRVPPSLRTRLRTASDLEFAIPQFTFGNDDRVFIQDTTQVPWRCICHLVVEGADGREVLGSGWLAGPCTVITAGHNLFSELHHHQAEKVWVLPGRSGEAVPFGYDSSFTFAVHPKWKSDGNREFDVGVIWLDKPIGERLGWFGFAAHPDAKLQNLLVNNAGYPADKPLGTQWFNAGRILEANVRTLTYGLDTEPGQSGSPIFYYDEQMRRIVVAIHAYGESGDNIGIRITPELFQTLTTWFR